MLLLMRSGIISVHNNDERIGVRTVVQVVDCARKNRRKGRPPSSSQRGWRNGFSGAAKHAFN
jgi:hypothetical protein